MKDPTQGKGVGNVIKMQIPTSLHVFMSTTSTTVTTKPLTKGIVISVATGGSSSKPPPSKKEKGDKGKGVEKVISEEEKKKNIEKEIERQRQINSIMGQRKGDPQSNKLSHLEICMILRRLRRRVMR